MTTKTISPEVLISAGKEIFDTMIFMDLRASNAAEEHLLSDTMLGTITFTGDIEGCLGICCHDEGAQSIAAGMLGMESTEELTAQDTRDAMGEICNMVMGCVKAALTENFGDIQVSIPTVVRGREIAHDMREHAETVIAPVLIDGKYHAEFSLQWRSSNL